MRVRGCACPSFQCHLFGLQTANMFKIQKLQRPLAEETSTTPVIISTDALMMHILFGNDTKLFDY